MKIDIFSIQISRAYICVDVERGHFETAYTYASTSAHYHRRVCIYN